MDTKGCVNDTGGELTTFSVPNCKESTCEIASLLVNPLWEVTSKDLKSYDQAMLLIQESLPCSKCSRGTAVMSVRLGKHERHLLLSAPGPDENKKSFLVATGTRSQKESKLRAMRKLSAAGLVECNWAGRGEWGGWYYCKNYSRRVIRRSPLGQAVVECIGEKIAAGERIRWQKHAEDIYNKTWVGIQELLIMLEKNIIEQLSMEKKMMAMVMQYQKDPTIRQKHVELFANIGNAHKAVKQCLESGMCNNE